MSRHAGRPIRPARSDIAARLVGHFVDQARRSGASWTEIGRSMGVTKQAAQQRSVPKLPAVTLDPEDGFSHSTPHRRGRVRRRDTQRAVAVLRQH